jgi:hypothetical protein
VIHPRLSVVLPATSILVGVAYAIAGQPVAIPWALGVAFLLSLPDLSHRFIRPFRSLRAKNAWMHLAAVVMGLGLAASYPIAWWVNVPVSRYPRPPFRHNSYEQVIFGAFSIAGLALAGWSAIDWWRHREDQASRLY